MSQDEKYIDVHHYKDNDYSRPRELFRFLEKLISPCLQGKNSPSFLDVGCAKGELLYFLKKLHTNPQIKWVGVDQSQTLIDVAKQYDGLTGVDFVVAPAEKFQTELRFDCINAAGIISWFDDYSLFLSNMLNSLKPGGTLFLTNGFTLNDYDVLIKYRDRRRQGEWLGGWNQHSMSGIKAFVEKHGKVLIPHKFEMPYALQRQEDVIRSWTLETNEGQKFTNGINMVWNLWSLEIK